MSEFKPYLSVVATSRNDNHGGNALERTQHFVSGLAAQALRFKLPVELILVDWNPPQDRVGLIDALIWPIENSYFHYRVIQVPQNYHAQFKYFDKLPLFQYLAKNVGIQRAKGEFVLATNIDILFSDALIQHIKNGLKQGYLYRVDRFDIDPNLPTHTSFPEVLKYAEDHIIRVNGIRGTVPYGESFYNKTLNMIGRFARSLMIFLGYALKNFKYYLTMPPAMREFYKAKMGCYENFFSLIFHLKRQFWFRDQVIHTNACGDFTLLSKIDWEKLKGYPEWALYSWHIDSLLMYQAHHNGIKMVNLDPSYAIYHIEHGQGSGWTPEGANLLFGRLDKNGIQYLDDEDLEELFFEQLQNKKHSHQTFYNQSWGAADQDFPENKAV